MSFQSSIVNFLVYDLRFYKLLPWEHGGRVMFAWPTKIWVKEEWQRALKCKKEHCKLREACKEAYHRQYISVESAECLVASAIFSPNTQDKGSYR